MKQFFYTSCRNGESVSGQSGFQIRAASAPLTSEENSACLRALNFKLEVPSDYSGPFPLKLLFAHAGNSGNFALQSVWLGLDPITKRVGNYFAHVLCDLPREINAQTVLEWWKSPLWKCENEEIPETSLPVPEPFPANEIFTDAIFTEMQADSEMCSLWEFILRAWWTKPASGRIFTAAPQEKFVKALWALCRILPKALWNHLSFSTYEKDAMLTPANVVCLWDPIKPENSIPQNCFAGSNLSWNLFSGQKSSLIQVSRYLEWIIQSVKSGKWEEVDSFHAGAPEIMWSKKESAEMFFELSRHPDTLDITRLKELSQMPNIGRFVMKNPKRAQHLLANFFSSKLLDLWDDDLVHQTFTPFFSAEDGPMEQFKKNLHEMLRNKILSGDLNFLERFYVKWLPRLTVVGLTKDAFWDLFNEAPGKLPKSVYLWAYPKAFRQVFHLPEPSMQIEYLTKWSFHGDDSRCEPQIKEILQSSFPNIVKIELYRRFFENDFRGNDENYSRFYFAWPEWNVQLLLKLEPEQKKQFLKHLLPESAPTLLSAIQSRLMDSLKGKFIWNNELFTIYCSILAISSLPITDSVVQFARKLPEERLAQISAALQRREDIEQLIQKKSLLPLFGRTAPNIFEKLLRIICFWKK